MKEEKSNKSLEDSLKEIEESGVKLEESLETMQELKEFTSACTLTVFAQAIDRAGPFIVQMSDGTPEDILRLLTKSALIAARFHFDNVGEDIIEADDSKMLSECDELYDRIHKDSDRDFI